MRGSLCLAAALALGSGALARNPSDRIYAGLVGGKYPIHMWLTIDGKRLAGYYTYDRGSEKLRVKGSVGAEGAFTMDEFYPNGTPTGLFRGRFLPDGTMTGMWSEPSGARPLKFVFRELGEKKPPSEAKPFEGVWRDAAGKLMLTLRQEGMRLTGFHTLVTPAGGRVSTKTSGPPSLTGAIDGGVATVRFRSNFAGSGAARLERDGEALVWRVTSHSGRLLFPERARLTRAGADVRQTDRHDRRSGSGRAGAGN